MRAGTARCLALVVSILAVTAGGCNQQQTVLDTPVSPSPPSSPGPRVTSVAVSPSVVDGGRQATGTVSISDQATGSGVIVSLSSSDQAATVPVRITIPAGSNSAPFTVATREVSADRTVVISASTSAGSAAASVVVWAPNPQTYFRFASEPGHAIGRGEIARYTPPSRFESSCTAQHVNFDVNSPEFHFWQMSFGAAAGQPLRVGVYEDAGGFSRDDQSRPLLFVGGRSRHCSANVGRFQIHDIDMQNDRVNRFHASFEHRCLDDGGSPWLRGEIRFVDGGASASATNCYRAMNGHR